MSVFGDDEPFRNELKDTIEDRIEKVGFCQAMLEVHQVLAYLAEYAPFAKGFKS